MPLACDDAATRTAVGHSLTRSPGRRTVHGPDDRTSDVSRRSTVGKNGSMSTGSDPVDVLIAYASVSGSTASVAEALAEALRAQGRSVDLADLADGTAPGDIPPDRARAVVVGSCVRHDSFAAPALVWIERHAPRLADMPVALFSVSASAALRGAAPQKATAEAARHLSAPPIALRDFPGWIRPDLLSEADRGHIEGYGAPVGDFRDLDAVRAWGDEIAQSLG